MRERRALIHEGKQPKGEEGKRSEDLHSVLLGVRGNGMDGVKDSGLHRGE